MESLAGSVDRLAAETGFSGAVRVDQNGAVAYERGFGLAQRAHGVPNTVDTQFGTASGTKGLTALTVMSLVESGSLDLATTAVSVLGEDLPLIGDGVTVEHLLAHRSGIGDYLDEESIGDRNEYVLTVPPHELVDTEQYLRVLDGHAATSAPDEEFRYCNGGYVVLALIAERVSGTAFADLVVERVCEPAGMHDTRFLRSDELPGRAAIGYLEAEGDRSNVFHLPVRGTGDGGIYSTAGDMHRLWDAVFAGRIVSAPRLAEMIRPRSDVPSESERYGLGFWLHPSSDTVILEGYDAGVSFRSVHDPHGAFTHTVVSNTADGAWPITRHLMELLEP